MIKKNSVDIYLGDNGVVKATKIGTIKTYFNAFGRSNEVNIKNLFYVKETNANLIGYGKLTENNIIMSKGDLTKIVDKVIAAGFEENKVIKLSSKFENRRNFINSLKRENNISQKKKWHRILGHVNFGYLNVLFKQ